MEAIYSYTWHLGWIWPFMFTAGALLFTPFNNLLSVNPLLWRSFGRDDALMVYMHATNGSWADFSNHHTLNLMAVAVLSFGLAGWLSRRTGISFWKWGVLASYGAVLVWSVHEGMWWLTYGFLWKPSPVVFSGFGELIVVVLLIMTPTLGLFVPRSLLFWMFLFQLNWALWGFPITESYKGETGLYSNLWANLWEVASWIWACGWFYLGDRKDLLAWFERIKALSFSRVL